MIAGGVIECHWRQTAMPVAMRKLCRKNLQKLGITQLQIDKIDLVHYTHPYVVSFRMLSEVE